MALSDHLHQLIANSNVAYEAYLAATQEHERRRRLCLEAGERSVEAHKALIEAKSDADVVRTVRDYREAVLLENEANVHRSECYRGRQLELYEAYKRAFSIAAHAFAEEIGLVWAQGAGFAPPTGNERG